MADNRDDYWSNEIKSYDGQWDTGPDDKHELEIDVFYGGGGGNAEG